MATGTIEINNVGPIGHLEIPIPESGVVVLRGANGSGKTTALKAVQQTLGGKTKGLSVRDDAGRGEVKIGSAKLTVTAGRKTRKGELEVESLESQFDISKLVDPGFDNVESADAARVKALLQLTGVAARADDYYELCGGKEEFLKLGIDTDTDDPVLLGSRVKRALEARARTYDQQADEHGARVKVLAEQVGDIKTPNPIDLNPLQVAYDDSRDEVKKLKALREAGLDAAERSKAAKARLEELENTSFESVDVLQTNMAKLKEERALLDQRLAEIKQQIVEQDSAIREHEKDIQTVAEHVAKIQELREVLHQSAGEPVSEERILDAIRESNDRFSALGQAQQHNESLLRYQELKDARAEKAAAEQMAIGYREGAKSVDTVLSTLLPDGPLRLVEGRLVVSSDRSEKEPYAELSDGERWGIAITIGANRLRGRDHGLLVVPQVAYEGLAPSLRKTIDQHAKDCGVVVLTAHADDCELTAESEV